MSQESKEEDDIRKDVKQRLEKEKKLEEQIKNDLEETPLIIAVKNKSIKSFEMILKFVNNDE
jgi:ankyrin repeat protein